VVGGGGTVVISALAGLADSARRGFMS